MAGLGANQHGGKAPNRVVGAAKIRIEDLIPGIWWEFVQWNVEATNARIVDKNVEAAERGVNVAGQALDRGNRSYIALEDICMVARA